MKEPKPKPRKRLAKLILAESNPDKRLKYALFGFKSTPEMELVRQWKFLADMRGCSDDFLLTLTDVSGEEPPSAASKVFADITADGKPFMTKFARLFAHKMLAMDSGWFRRIAKAIDFLGNTPKAEDPLRTLLLFNETLPEGERFCTRQMQSEL